MKDLPTFGVAETTPIIRQPCFACKLDQARADQVEAARARIHAVEAEDSARLGDAAESQGISTAFSRVGSEMIESVVPCSAVKGDTPEAC